MTHFQSLSAAGFAATAISYGPGRVGFGLFVPAFSGAFSLDGTTIGLISSLGFGGFFLIAGVGAANAGDHAARGLEGGCGFRG